MATPATGGTVPHGDTGKRGESGGTVPHGDIGPVPHGDTGNYAARGMIGAPAR